MKKSKSKYSVKEKLDIAESVVTILMFVMAVWGSIITFEEGFWRDAYKTSYCFPNRLRVKYGDNDFRVKRWAYIKDLEQL